MAFEISHLRHIELLTPELDSQRKFYVDTWGLDDVFHDAQRAVLRGSSPEFFLLALRRAESRGIHHLAFAMPSPADVDRAESALASAGVPIVSRPGKSEEPGGGYRLRFIDPDGRCVELSAQVERQDRPAPERRVSPSSICHVVLNTPDIDGICGFYTGVLGFRISDWSEHQMVFLRCSSKHHVISFNQAPHPSLNHIAYLLSGVDEVMRGVSQLRERGYSAAWGPGRHGPGNNIFCYFIDPAGYVTEYTSDIDHITDDAAHEVKVWPRSPESIDRWGMAGLPSPAVRAAMTGDPDPGWAQGKDGVWIHQASIR